MIRETSVGCGVDDEKDVPAIIGEGNDVSFQILEIEIKDGGSIGAIWVTVDFFIAFVNASGGGNEEREEEKGE